jgi:epoxyqueuosine reductase
MDALENRVYGCDICQDVCPWNRGVEKRRTGDALPADAQPVVSLVDWLERDGDELAVELDRLYVPRNDPAWLRRNALVALGNVGADSAEELVRRYVDDPEPAVRAAARRVLASIAERSSGNGEAA